MLRLEWTTPAADQLEYAQDYYHALNPMAATLMAMRIVEAAQRLCDQPAMGRPGRVQGTAGVGGDQNAVLAGVPRTRRYAGNTARLA